MSGKFLFRNMHRAHTKLVQQYDDTLLVNWQITATTMIDILIFADSHWYIAIPLYTLCVYCVFTKIYIEFEWIQLRQRPKQDQWFFLKM